MKSQNTIGCCGIDCGLCPRYHTKGDSACPGCGAESFKEKHPSCGFLTCCVTKNNQEVCTFCNDFPCKRFDKEQNGYDSFVTHQNIFPNHNLIKDEGIERFIQKQQIRMNILNYFIDNYDDGRSKSFYCISCTLLPINELQKIQHFMGSLNDNFSLKEKNNVLKEQLLLIAENLRIKLKLNNKTH
jgi:hypothetical protein